MEAHGQKRHWSRRGSFTNFEYVWEQERQRDTVAGKGPLEGRVSSGPRETKDEKLKQDRKLHKLRVCSGPGETMRFSSRRGSSRKLIVSSGETVKY